jgi:uncharacterized protein with ParB-like and HNH nuclease domain
LIVKVFKVDDIPQLIVMNGGVSWSLSGIEETLDRWKKSYGLDLDPDFQRGHVWTQAQKVRFIEFLLRGGQVPPLRLNSPVFAGAKHDKYSDLSEDVVLVDGKQRLTACLEFLQNKIEVFGGYTLDEFDNPRKLLNGAEILYQVNKLQTRRELLEWYLQINEGQVAHTEEELQRVRALLGAAQ